MRKNISIPKELNEALREYCKDTEQKESTFINSLIREKLTEELYYPKSIKVFVRNDN